MKSFFASLLFTLVALNFFSGWEAKAQQSVLLKARLELFDTYNKIFKETQECGWAHKENRLEVDPSIWKANHFITISFEPEAGFLKAPVGHSSTGYFDFYAGYISSSGDWYQHCFVNMASCKRQAELANEKLSEAKLNFIVNNEYERGAYFNAIVCAEKLVDGFLKFFEKGIVNAQKQTAEK